MPLSEAASTGVRYLVESVPTFDHVLPPLVLICHWIVAMGSAKNVTLNVAELPAAMVWLIGWAMITGADVTVSVATWDMTVPLTLVRMAWNCSPSRAPVAVKDSTGAVAP